MRMPFLIPAAALVVLLAGGRLAAHHSFAAEFDGSKPVTLKGTVTKMEWTNPHAWLHIDHDDRPGQQQSGGTDAVEVRAGLHQLPFQEVTPVTICAPNSGGAKGRCQMRRRLAASVIAIALLSAAPKAAIAQTFAPPRTPEGKPNLQGIWQVMNTAAWDIQDHGARLGVPAGQGIVVGNEIPYQPWALQKKRENFANRLTADPETKGYLPGVPRIMYMPFPFQIFQTPNSVAMTFEYDRGVRIIYTNGTPHPRGPINWWMGDSRGHWEGDTLVVDVIHFTDQTWLDRAGNFHSDRLHLTERYTLAGPDHMNYEVTAEDPMVFTGPWKMSMLLYRRKDPNVRLLEYDPGLLMDEEQARRERDKTN